MLIPLWENEFDYLGKYGVDLTVPSSGFRPS